MPKSLQDLILAPTPEMVEAGVRAMSSAGDDLEATVQAVWRAMRLVRNRPGRPLLKPDAQVKAIADLRVGVSPATVARTHGLTRSVVTKLRARVNKENQCTSS